MSVSGILHGALRYLSRLPAIGRTKDSLACAAKQLANMCLTAVTKTVDERNMLTGRLVFFFYCASMMCLTMSFTDQ